DALNLNAAVAQRLSAVVGAAGERQTQFAHERRSHGGLEVRIAALVELVVGVAHGLGLGAADHHLEIHGLERIVLIAVDHTGRAGDALPGPAPRGGAPARFGLDYAF